ncbi:hypothetical protein BC829DRAFT_490307 [Chytridium lagenaria]|nr:hypothetical protein BC829DRAFT_490307 [Chytridium lagenaria]
MDKWTVLMRKAIMAEFTDAQASMARKQDKAIEMVGRRYVETVASLTSQLRDAQELASLYRNKFEARNVAMDHAAAVIARQQSRSTCAVLFSRWRSKLEEERRYRLAVKFADMKAKSFLLRRIVLGWQKTAGATWRRATEKRIRMEAEKAISQLSVEYESRMTEMSSLLSATQSKLHDSEIDRSRAQEDMKRALMRGVCALNMEAMSVFRGQNNPDTSIPFVPAPSSASTFPFPVPTTLADIKAFEESKSTRPPVVPLQDAGLPLPRNFHGKE